MNKRGSVDVDSCISFKLNSRTKKVCEMQNASFLVIRLRHMSKFASTSQIQSLTFEVKKIT